MKELRVADPEDLGGNGRLFWNNEKFSYEGKDSTFSLYPRMSSKNWILLWGIFQSNIVKIVSDKLSKGAIFCFNYHLSGICRGNSCKRVETWISLVIVSIELGPQPQ